MHSYIGIHPFTPLAKYNTLTSEIPFIERAISDQNVKALLGAGALSAFKENIVKCMEVYYKLMGITDEVIASEGKVEPRGVLPRYTESLIRYFSTFTAV